MGLVLAAGPARKNEMMSHEGGLGLAVFPFHHHLLSCSDCTASTSDVQDCSENKYDPPGGVDISGKLLYTDSPALAPHLLRTCCSHNDPLKLLSKRGSGVVVVPYLPALRHLQLPRLVWAGRIG